MNPSIEKNFYIFLFKHVNDIVGYTGGNQLLKIVGDLIKGTMVGLGSAARLGSDEFVFLIPNVSSIKTIILA